MSAPYIILTVLLGLLVLLLCLSYYTYSVTFRRRTRNKGGLYKIGPKELVDKIAKMREELEAVPCEEVSTISSDGLRLSARLYITDPSRPFEIQFHGYRSNPVRDFSGGGMEVLKRGDNLLLVYQRAGGKSEGRTITFGIKERLDVISWIDFLLGRFGDRIKITLVGVSMGGATVLMASELPLPENVKYIVADCPFSSPKEIICRVAKSMGFPPALAYPLIKLGALIYGRFNPDSHSASEAVKSSKTPILLLHGEKDGFVPMEMSEKIQLCAPDTVTLKSFPHADHGMSYLTDRDGYMREINEFRQKHLKGDTPIV